MPANSKHTWSAGNRERLHHQHQGQLRSKEEVYLAILGTRFKRDLALNRHNVSNIAVDVARGTFRRHEDDATSVKMLVCLC
jgi:hypothetical protein